jgi:isopenicillin-N epimerase
MERNRLMAAAGAKILAESLGAHASAPLEMRAAMAALSLGDAPSDPGSALKLRQVLAREYGVVVPVHIFAGKLWLRISAQIYNEIDDYRRCAEALRAAGRSVGIWL